MFARATDAAAALVAPATPPRRDAGDPQPLPLRRQRRRPPVREETPVVTNADVSPVVTPAPAPAPAAALAAPRTGDDGSRASPHSGARRRSGADRSRGDGRHGPDHQPRRRRRRCSRRRQCSRPCPPNRRRRASPAIRSRSTSRARISAPCFAPSPRSATASTSSSIPSIQGTVDVSLRDVPWDQALDIILRANKLGYTRRRHHRPHRAAHGAGGRGTKSAEADRGAGAGRRAPHDDASR